MNQRYTSKYVASLGLFSAFAVIASYIESLIPIHIGIPGIKIGLPNIIIVLVLYLLDAKSAIIVNIIRIIIVGAMFGNAFSILFSISGAIVSFLIMYLVKKINKISMLGVSVCGGVAHNIAQIVIASFIVKTYNLNYYLPFMIIGGLITGILIGILSMTIYNKICNIEMR